MKNTTNFLLTAALLVSALLAQAQEQLISLSFEDAPLEQAVELYREWTGRTIIKQADLRAKITLKGRQLTKDEAKQAIETVLAMHGVALVPMGEKFLKVIPIANARQEGMEIEPFNPGEKYVEADTLITQVIPLRYVIFQDVQPLIQHLIHGYGKVQYLDRINSVLITDTSANISRIVELITMVDQPVEKIKPRIYRLNYAEAGTVADKLKELVEAAKTKKSEQIVVAGGTASVPGVIRAPKSDAAPVNAMQGLTDDTEMIQGEVKFVADERTNILIIFSKAANFEFFDNIINVLDVPVDPAVVVETVNLEYAEANEIAGILNEFVGAAKASEQTKAPGKSDNKTEEIAEVAREVARSTGREITPLVQNAIGRLSADTKILSDERTNSLLLMGRKSDIEALKKVISNLDVMLEQVLIEVVILSVGLGDSLQTGIQWVYQNVEDEGELTYTTDLRPNTAISDGGVITTTSWSNVEVPRYKNEDLSRIGFDAAGLSSNMVSGALSYYGVFPTLNLETIISAAKTDSDARILSTPVVLTTDNTEAKITVADERPVITSSVTGTSSTSARSTYEYKTIGIDLTVTPHINPQRFVLMDITQSADDVGGNVQIDGNDVPIISKREIAATVAVQDRQTIVLGGLIRKNTSRSATKIPILGDIPLLGWLFSSHSNSDDRSELIVLLTPYVLTNPEEALRETERRYNASDAKKTLWPHGWSESPLANDEPAKDDDQKDGNAAPDEQTSGDSGDGEK
ncbi:MAG: ral secretion pathway protein [Verrucomicrobiota bacterium]|jgi:general secretion pathway protein D|nr:ral secretion pathway protein [Verrucomicrobiota bacterium]